MHVRHGDKRLETAVYSNEQYLNMTWVAFNANSLLRKQLILHTEDSNTTRFFTNLTQQGWQLSYVDFRRPDILRTRNYYDTVGNAKAMFLYLLNLDLLMACDAFVAPVNSNNARLVDELRSTSRCKADAVFVDPEQGSQYNTHPIIW